ncbi:MAG: 2-oxo acid dehydrogenase subunit E2, partial [Gammaproteobacteria bacterium]|nr:2-oxo acid dehydrogenase subunit E2 [Gammaproteobacteria bacterium]
MGIHTILLPDIGEGIAEAELVVWHCEIGDTIKEDDLVAEVMTDKAAIEVPSSVSGKVVWLGGEVGDMIAIGAKLIQVEVDGDGNDLAMQESADALKSSQNEESSSSQNEESSDVVDGAIESQSKPDLKASSKPSKTTPTVAKTAGEIKPRANGTKPLAAPSVRARAKEEGIDLRNVPGTGPAGRVSHQDLSDFIDAGGVGGTMSRYAQAVRNGTKDIKVIGMRRKIAEKMSLANSRIPHITIVEDVDMTGLEELRAALNKKHAGQRPKLTILPFIMRAIVEAVKEQPEMNARYDDDAGVVRQHAPVNIGVATQTENGLNVTVVHHAEAGSLWDNAEKVANLA